MYVTCKQFVGFVNICLTTDLLHYVIFIITAAGTVSQLKTRKQIVVSI